MDKKRLRRIIMAIRSEISKLMREEPPSAIGYTTAYMEHLIDKAIINILMRYFD